MDFRSTLEVVGLKPQYAFPPGTELAPGVIVQPRPYWLQHLPSWVSFLYILFSLP
jgi:hypothetical protein